MNLPDGLQKYRPKYLGDEYLLLFDTVFDNSDGLDYLYKRMSCNLPINEKLLSYENGDNMKFIRTVILNESVNKVYKTDPEKYKRIWASKDPKYPQKRKIQLENNNKSTAPNNLYG